MYKILICLWIYTVTIVNAACNCGAYFSTEYYVYKRNIGCNDAEALEQCKQASLELMDYVNGNMHYFREIFVTNGDLGILPNDDTLQHALDYSYVSEAHEKWRPVPDCATGLFTTTTLNGLSFEERYSGSGGAYSSKTFCFSQPLLSECKKVQNSMAEYQASIIRELEENPNVTQYVVDIVKIRIEHSIPPSVVCPTSDLHNDLVESSAPTIIVSGILSFAVLLI